VKRTIPEFLPADGGAGPGQDVAARLRRRPLHLCTGPRTGGEGRQLVPGGGVGPGDRVLVTARNTPDYLWTWLALMEVGAIWVAVNPAGTDDELAGLVGQVTPRLIVSDAELMAVGRCRRGRSRPGGGERALRDGRRRPGPAASDPDDVAVMIPTSGTTGRSKLVMQTHRAYVMAGEGFPSWNGAHPRRPAHDVVAALPHQMPRCTRSSDRWPRAPAWSCSRASRPAGSSRRPRFDAPSSTPSGPCWRCSCANRRARTTPGQSGCGSVTRDRHRPATPYGDRGAVSSLELVCGYGLSETPYGLIWRRGSRPFGTLGSGPPASGLGM